MKKTKVIISVLVLVLCLGLLTGCDGSRAYRQNHDHKIKVVCTVFPAYDWTRNIIGDLTDKYDITYLLASGVDIHSYQPSTADISEVSEADVFIHVGGESDAWVEDVIKNSKNRNLQTVNMMDVIGKSAFEEEFKEGMQGKEEDGDEEEPEYDEHVWLSAKRSIKISGAIAEALEKADRKDGQTLATNCDAYCKKLRALDKAYKNAIENGKKNTILFADRFPFRYMTEDYGLDYYAAFVGCSAETEANFNTIVFLAKKVDELDLPAVLTIENSNDRVAQTVIKTAKRKDLKTLTLDSMQSVSEERVEDGETYLKMMRKNLKVLKEALGE